MYRILSANTVAGLEAKVQEAMRRGFVPLGSPLLVTQTPLLVAQAVVWGGYISQEVNAQPE